MPVQDNSAITTDTALAKCYENSGTCNADGYVVSLTVSKDSATAVALATYSWIEWPITPDAAVNSAAVNGFTSR